MKKKALACIGCALAAVVSFGAFAACKKTAPTDEEGVVTVRFWNGFTGLDGDAMDDIVAAFNTEYSGKIKVEPDKMAWDTLFTKITTTKSNLRSAPHVVAMSSTRIAGMQERKILLPIDDIGEKLGVTQADYISSAWNAGVIGGTRYGFPLDIHPTAMFYNKALISEEELPTNWEDFLTVCKEKTDADTGVYGFAVPSMYSITKDIFASMLLQKGGTLYGEDNGVLFNSQAGIDSLEYLASLVHEHGVSPADVGGGGDYTLFRTGKSVFYFDGPWLLNQFGLIEGNTSGFEVGVAPMPGSVGENGVSYAGSHQFTLMKNTVTTDRIKDACYTFVRYVQQNSIRWARAGQVPALKAVTDSEEYKAISALQPFTQEALKADLCKCDYKYFYEGYNYMGTAVSNAISGKNEPKAALDDAARKFNNWIIDDGF